MELSLAMACLCRSGYHLRFRIFCLLDLLDGVL